jgi:NAD-dependent deacetylase
VGGPRPDGGGDTLELNLDPSAGADDFAQARTGPATELVPAWVDDVLGA